MTTGSRRSKHLAGKAHATACHGCPHVRILYIHTLRSIPLSIHGNVYLFFEALVLIRWGRGCTKIRGNRSWSPSAPFFFSSPRFISSLTLSLSLPFYLLLLLFFFFFFFFSFFFPSLTFHVLPPLSSPMSIMLAYTS